MAARSTKRIDPQFDGGPPGPPYLAIQRSIVERRPDGSLWRKPYRRTVIGGETERLDGGWQRIDTVTLRLIVSRKQPG